MATPETLGNTAANNARRLAYAGLVVTPLFWAGNAVVARGVVDSIPPMSMSFWRWMIALALVLPFAWNGIREHGSTIRQHWRSILMLGAMSVGAFNTLLYLAAETTTATNIALINATIPIMVALLAWLILGDRTRPIQMLGIGLALAGILAVISNGSWQALTTLEAQPGDLIMVLAVVCWGGFSVLLRRQAVPLPPVTFLACQIAAGLLVILPIYLTDLLIISGGFVLDKESASALAYFAVFPGILAFSFWNNGVRTLGPNSTAIFMYLTPVYGAVLAGLFLGETLQSSHLLGGLLILMGLLLATRTVTWPRARPLRSD